MQQETSSLKSRPPILVSPLLKGFQSILGNKGMTAANCLFKNHRRRNTGRYSECSCSRDSASMTFELESVDQNLWHVGDSSDNAMTDQGQRINPEWHWRIFSVEKKMFSLNSQLILARVRSPALRGRGNLGLLWPQLAVKNLIGLL